MAGIPSLPSKSLTDTYSPTVLLLYALSPVAVGGAGSLARERLVPLTVLRMSMAIVMGPTPCDHNMDVCDVILLV